MQPIQKTWLYYAWYKKLDKIEPLIYQFATVRLLDNLILKKPRFGDLVYQIVFKQNIRVSIFYAVVKYSPWLFYFLEF